MLATGGATKGQIDDLEAELTRYRSLRVPVQQQLRLDEEFGANQLTRMSDALETMNKKLAIARDNLSNLVIVAPIDGQLTSLEANAGESKARGNASGQVDEQDEFKVSAFVDEFYLSRVIVGQLAEVDIDGKRYELAVVKEYPDVRDRQFEIDLAFTGERAGRSAAARPCACASRSASLPTRWCSRTVRSTTTRADNGCSSSTSPANSRSGAMCASAAATRKASRCSRAFATASG